MAPSKTKQSDTANKTAEKKLIGLPLSVASPVDLGRLIRELDMIDNTLNQAHLRQDTTAPKLPKTTILMDQTIELNKIDLLHEADRQNLRQFLVSIRERAPQLHISFSADPSEQFITKMIEALRRIIHPLVLMTIGLQPSIGAGCVVRTTNKYFDFSLAKDMSKNRELLMKQLRASIASIQPAAAPAAVAPTAIVAEAEARPVVTTAAAMHTQPTKTEATA